MKKIFLFAIAAMFTVSASAEGYQVNTLSAKQFGMGHTSVSQKLGSESVWFNPGAAAYQQQKFSISAGMTGIQATAKWTSMNDYTSQTESHTSDNDLSTPIHIYANYKITDDLAFGVSFNTPYGSSMNWGDDWAGAHLVQNISLQSFTAQPTLSYKFLDGKLSVGAGLMMSWGTFELSRSMFAVGDTTNAIVAALAASYGMTDAAAAILTVGDTPLASATLGGDAGLKMGVNVGIMYDINKRWSLGASYRSKMVMAVDSGTAELNYANEIASALLSSNFAGMDTGTFSAELPLPSTLSVGATFRPTERLEIAAELQWVQWSAYDSLVVSFNEDGLSGYDQNAVKNYSNTMITRIGGQYNANDWLTLRLGFYVDESPVASDYLNPETPSMTKVGYTGGISIAPCKKNPFFSIDLAYGYIASADPERAGSYPTINNLTGSLEVFSGNYETKAHTGSVGLSWGF